MVYSKKPQEAGVEGMLFWKKLLEFLGLLLYPLNDFFYLEFSPCKALPLELQEKEAQKDLSIPETCLERTSS